MGNYEGRRIWPKKKEVKNKWNDMDKSDKSEKTKKHMEEMWKTIGRIWKHCVKL